MMRHITWQSCEFSTSPEMRLGWLIVSLAALGLMQLWLASHSADHSVNASAGPRTLLHRRKSTASAATTATASTAATAATATASTAATAGSATVAPPLPPDTPPPPPPSMRARELRALPSVQACRAALPPQLRNPVFELGRKGRVRDPAVRLINGTHELYYTHYEGDPKRMFSGSALEGYTVRTVRTSDWTSFSPPETVTPHGFVSPDAPVRWKGTTLLAYQAYPDKALGGPRSGLFLSHRVSAKADKPAHWSMPAPFLEEALDLPWNTQHRAIDPTLFVGPDGKLHCFFIGSTSLPQPASAKAQRPRRANLLGHAVTDDTKLKRWRVVTTEKPLLGVSERAPDGVENVAVFQRHDGSYQMIYSEGLVAQHLAYAVSSDLYTWHDRGQLKLAGAGPVPAGAVDVRVQAWMAGRYGAPFVWRDSDGCFRMTLMGEYEVVTHRSAVGLLGSADGEQWELLAEKRAYNI